MKPLAYALRPTKIDDIYGQLHLVGPNGVIRKMIANNQLQSMIFYGNPGIGKTTLALAICNELNIPYEQFNASNDNKARLKEIIDKALSYDRFVLIVDENDRAVKDFEVLLYRNKKIIPDFENHISTNKNGLCIFYNIPGGEYDVSAQKGGYTKITSEKLNFENRSELYCYRVYSADFILEQTEQFYKKSEYQKALELLETICSDDNTLLQNTVSFYKAYGYARLNQKEKAGFELQNIMEHENPAFKTSEYCGVIEQLLEAQPDV